jgi:hypothetical protein
MRRPAAIMSASTVGCVELPDVGHGFDLIDGARTANVVAGIDPQRSIGRRRRRGYLGAA